MFKINGTSVAEPKLGGIIVTDEPIWSSNTGRSSTGKMIGDIIAWKTTIEVSWPPLTYAQAKAIRDAIKSGGEFFDIQYKDVSAGINDGSLKTEEKNVYAANIPRTLYSLSTKYPRYDGITVQFIER